MCKCTPEIRTPFCGKPGCEWPKNKEGIRPHGGSMDTYLTIADWIAPDFFFSKTDLWDRMGFLGFFCDYVLSCTHGDVAEIGVGESSIYLSHVARKYNRRMYHCDASPSKIINPLTVPGYLTKEATDPTDQLSIQEDNSYLFMRDSDLFFEMNIEPLALAFIDGDHNFAQAKKDFDNFVPLIVDNGYILLHDTYPPNKEYLSENACGDVFELRKIIEEDSRFDCMTLPRGTAMGVGLTLVRKRPAILPYWQQKHGDALTEG